MSTETLDFRISADAGILLMNIAQEHLLYRTDIDKALNVFNESFGGGCPDDMMLKLLTGDMVIEVDVDTQQFMVDDRKPEHEGIFPKLDLLKFFAEKQKQMDEHLKDIEKGLDALIDKFRYSNTYRFYFSAETIMKYIYGNDEDLIADIREDEELKSYKSLIKITYEFIKKSMDISNLCRKVNGLYGTDIEFDTYDLLNLTKKVQEIARLDFNFTEGHEDNVQNYLEATVEIDEIIKTGIEPVDIMDNYSAGWLSPEGEYYALNGEIANMLHNQIADALQEKGLIPENDEHGHSQSPDTWLEQQGWVKIHGNNVHFAGCLNHKLRKTNVDITEKQIDVICDYIENCHACEIKVGWRLTRQSVTMFRVAARDLTSLYRRFFSFD